MDDEWKEWDVVEDMRKIKVPGFMFDSASSAFNVDGIKARIQREWEWFVELLNTNGDGTGYERLLTLQDNMEDRKERFSGRLEKWEDRRDWLELLRNEYLDHLQTLVVESPTPPSGQRDSHVDSLTARPIVEAFVDFNDNGRLDEWPNLKDGWTLTTGTILQGPGDTGDLLQTFGYGPEDVDARRENTTVRYRFSDEELERKGINLDNLESPRRAIRMKPTTTWDEALSQLDEKEKAVMEELSPPKRTVRVLDFRLRILENVLHRFEAFGSVEMLSEEKAEEAARESVQSDSTPDPWEKNAAMMHAYFSNHGAPDKLGDIDEVISKEGLLDSFSHEHAWKKLRREEWAASKGSIEALEEALAAWAEDFEEKHGEKVADRLAGCFNWPSYADRT